MTLIFLASWTAIADEHVARGVEGWCVVEYTVTADGTVKDPFLVDEYPKGHFEKACKKAALKFKYKPRMVDGMPVETKGVQNKITFKIE